MQNYRENSRFIRILIGLVPVVVVLVSRSVSCSVVVVPSVVDPVVSLVTLVKLLTFDQCGSFWQLSFAQFDSFWAHGAHCMVVLIDPIPVPLMFQSVKHMYGINLCTLTMIYFLGLQS